MNPSFEQVKNCPTFLGQIDSCIGWTSFCRSPDYFNSCSSNQSGFSIPNNRFGHQAPSDGNAYAGIGVFDSTNKNLNFREYLATELLLPLKIGKKYYVRFKTSLAYGMFYGCVMATNNIGAKFTTYKGNEMTKCLTVSNSAHINSPQIISDTINWTLISGSFIADSSYKYLVIGNFFESKNTLYKQYAYHPEAKAYYFIDDVCVTSDSLDCSLITSLSKEIKLNSERDYLIYPNPAINEIWIKGYSEGEVLSVFITDVCGRIVKTEKVNVKGEVSLMELELNNGIYFVTLVNGMGEKFVKKLVISK